MAKKTKTEEIPPLDSLKAATIAKLYRVDPSAVSKWASRDGCPRNADGSWDLAAIIEWRESRLAAAAESEQSGVKSEELEGWRKARRQLAELDLAQRQGELLDRAEVERGRVERIQVVRASMLALPRQLAPALVGLEQREIAQLLKEAMENLCRTFAGQKPVKR